MFYFSESFLAVDLFFVLSGFVIANAYEQKLSTGLSLSRFIQIRYIRLYPLYALGTGIGLLNALWFDLIDSTFYVEVFFALFMLPSAVGHGPFRFNGPAWSLFPEIVANVIFAIAAPRLSNAKLLLVCGTGLIGIIALAFFTPNHSLDIGWTKRSYFAGLIRVMYSFPTGVLIYRFSAYIRQSKWQYNLGNIFTLTILGIVAALLIFPIPKAVRPLYELATIVVIFPGLVTVAILGQPDGPIAKICHFLGATSYAIYVIHAPLSALIGHTFVTNGANVTKFDPWLGLVFLIVLLMLSWFLDQQYDQPLRKILLSFFKNRRGNQTDAVETSA